MPSHRLQSTNFPNYELHNLITSGASIHNMNNTLSTNKNMAGAVRLARTVAAHR